MKVYSCVVVVLVFREYVCDGKYLGQLVTSHITVQLHGRMFTAVMLIVSNTMHIYTTDVKYMYIHASGRPYVPGLPPIGFIQKENERAMK